MQILVDNERYARLMAYAKQTGASIGQVVRDAIDEKVPARGSGRDQAFKRILKAHKMQVGPPEELRAELEDLRGGKFGHH